MQLTKAESFLHQITVLEKHVPELQKTLPMLKQSVRTYYTAVHHRNLALHYILHDLDVLQKTFSEDLA